MLDLVWVPILALEGLLPPAWLEETEGDIDFNDEVVKAHDDQSNTQG